VKARRLMSVDVGRSSLTNSEYGLANPAAATAAGLCLSDIT